MYFFRLNPKSRMHKALCLITIAWVIPVLYGMLAMSGWSCTSGCTCTLHYESQAPICPQSHCSRLYTPMSKSYLLVIVGMWFLECTVLLVLLCRSAFSAAREQTPRGKSATTKKCSIKLLKCPHIPASHTFLLVLLGLFVACTSPVMVLITLDYACPDVHVSQMLVNMIVPLPLLYCFISPVLLTRRLAAMKSAVLMTFSCKWCIAKKKNRDSNKHIRKKNKSLEDSSIMNSRIDSLDAV